MAVPKQVQAQLDEANRIVEELNKPPQEGGGDPPPDLAKLATEPAANAPQATAEPPTTVAPPVVTPTKQDEETWEARYKALNGMYKKQVPELQQQVRQLTTDLEKAMRQINEIATAKPTPQEPPQPTADPQDVEAFGEDLVNMVRRTAERLFGNVARAMEANLGTLEKRLSEVETRLEGTHRTAHGTAEVAFFERLTKLVPEWEQVNEDDRFKAWCLEIDPMYGVPRQTALNNAQNALDADRVAAVLKTYLGTTTPPPKTSPPVEQQVSPRAVASAPPPPPTGKPVITNDQIDKFYRDVAQGRYRGREAEAARIEQVINDALAEGRIR
jgi:hypothetical protein